MSSTDGSMLEHMRPSRQRRTPQLEYRLIKAVLSPLFLVVAAISFLLPRSVRANVPGLDVKGSLLARARSLASTTLPYAFMG